jgi:hypothetical protein
MDKQMTRSQYDKWLKKLDPHVCTFCDPKKQIILKEFEFWYWVANLAPYWKYHTMIVPKRHFEKYSDMTMQEAGELVKVIDYGEKKIIDARIERDDGSLVKKVVYFWRFRLDRLDKVSGTVRPNHFHLHLAPDKDHLWDSILDDKATENDLELLK